MPTEGWAARVDDVTKTYRTPAAEVRALARVTAQFPRAALTAVVGPSGSGKSSLLRLLVGMDRPSGGDVVVGGLALHRAGARQLRHLRRRTVGYVFQRPSDNFISYLTVEEHLRMAAAGGPPRAREGRAVLEDLGIAHRLHHLPAELSGGEQQRAAFAQALVTGAAIVVADEPTAELDGDSAAVVLEKLHGLVAAGVTIVVATHDAAVRRAADQVIELDHGRLRTASPAERVPASPSSVAPAPYRPAAFSPPAPATATPEAPSAPVLIRASDVTRTYRRGDEVVHALRGVDLELRAGEVVAVIGRSGSGKTTLLNLIAGWEPPDAGEVGWMASDGDLRAWRDVAVLPQRLSLIDELTVRENVELPARLAGVLPETRNRVEALLEQLGLAALAGRAPNETSVGEQQRTAMARALVLSPRLLLADEPTSHQDEASTSRVFEALAAAAAEGTCCLVATHDEGAARQVRRVLRLEDGLLAP